MGLSASDREFVAIGAAIGAGCHPCTQYHTQAALREGLRPEEVAAAIEGAVDVRVRGAVAVANVGRRLLAVEQEELAPAAAPPSRGAALARLGAAAGCNSGPLLTEGAGHAADFSIDAGEMREVADIAEMVKTQAAKFLVRDVERALGPAPAAPEAAAVPAVGGCPPQEAAPAAVGAVAAADCSPSCDCE